MHIDDPVTVQISQIYSLSGLLAQIFHVADRYRKVGVENILLGCQRKQFGAQPVFPGFRVLKDKAAKLHTLEDPIYRALRHLRKLGKFLNAEFLIVRGEAFQNMKSFQKRRCKRVTHKQCALSFFVSGVKQLLA